MVDCSLCSLISFFGSCVYNIIAAALEYPIVVFVLSFVIAVLLISNVTTAKLLCDIGSAAARSYNEHVAPNIGRSTATCETNTFNYGADRGPHTWCCSDLNQSPINIIDEHVQKFPIRELLTWNHYDDLPIGIMLENNGHTVVLRAAFSGNVPTLSGADLLASYTFVELCFRWSLLSNEGSEHMINYRKYPLEIQAMHRTGPCSDCTSSYDLLMVSYLYDISNNNPYLDPIVQNLQRIQKPGTKIEIAPFPISYLCYQFRTNFYSYGGSLTEPPCYQGAEWFIYPEPLAIGERQLNEFQQILGSDGKSRIVRNARPVQNMNESRVVSLNQYNPIETVDIGEESVMNAENSSGGD